MVDERDRRLRDADALSQSTLTQAGFDPGCADGFGERRRHPSIVVRTRAQFAKSV
jgi:hypothetical protein